MGSQYLYYAVVTKEDRRYNWKLYRDEISFRPLATGKTFTRWGAQREIKYYLRRYFSTEKIAEYDATFYRGKSRLYRR